MFASTRTGQLFDFVHHAPLLAASDLVQAMEDYWHRLTTGDYSYFSILLEILLITAAVYSVLRFLQGTRGARLIKSVALILLAAFVLVKFIAQQFALDRIIYLYPYFVTGVFLVALVVFQTELRRGLIRLGEGRFWTGRWRRAERLVDPIVQAVARLAKLKVGALIAVERTTEVGGVIDSGVRIDGRISAELLTTIFWPTSPLHDLGVVIQRGRIAAARCQFPSAEFDEIEQGLGSRHRAALAMSQECDALIVVVSEETGMISVAEFGTLQRGLSPDELREFLMNRLSRTPELDPSTEQSNQGADDDSGQMDLLEDIDETPSSSRATTKVGT